jgi:hypothetical protein
LTLWARGASDEAIEEAYEILAIERRVRASAGKPKATNGSGTTKKPASKKPAAAPPPANDAEKAGEAN